jgi:hypothetical protein
MPSYRKPTEKEAAKLDAARKKTQEGIAGEKDIFSKTMPTMAKSARDEVKAGLKMRESVPASAREGEAYEQAGYKKGGKVMKKMKKYEGGGSIDSDVRARAMKSVEGLEGIKGSDIEDETGTVKGSIKRNEYGDLYDSEMKATPKATPKAAAPTPKAEPKSTPVAKTGEEKSGFEAKKAKALEGTSVKAEAPAPKESPKEEKSFLKGTKGYKNFGALFKSMREKAGITSYKSGGKVSSASKRADGCAIRGKTRA